MSDSDNLGGAERFFLVSPIERVDVRGPNQNHDDTWTFSGYAAVFDQQTTAFDDGFDRFTIEIAPEAFTNVLQTQALTEPAGAVHFNLGHDMNTAVASTDVPKGQPGSLDLAADTYGLRFFAKVARDDPDGQRMAVKMRDGVIRQASFAFVAEPSEFTRTELDDGGMEVNRRITGIRSLHDVCACPQGMFSQTVSGLQQYAKLLGQPDMGGRRRQPDLGGASPVNSATRGEAAASDGRLEEVARMRALHRPIVVST
jgi:HK97 family phage prohead protease